MGKRRVAVVIPTYNEGDTIRRMIKHLFERTLPSIKGWDVHVVIVDGNSPDGTAGVVRQEQGSRPNLHLIVEEKKEGIGAAYFKGFRYAMREIGVEVLIEFDGDFQHPPEAIKDLLERIEAGADLVLGSRRVRGGGYPSGWDLHRLFLSLVGGFVTRFLLFFPTRTFRLVTDPTTGLKATRVAGFAERLDFESFHSRGFAYKIEMLYRVIRMGAVVAEIPLQFAARSAGESKITDQTAREIFSTVLALRWRDEDTRRFLRFAVVGTSGFVINAVALELFIKARFVHAMAGLMGGLSGNSWLGFAALPSSWAAACAAECAILNNYLWNHLWTFASRNPRRRSRLLVNLIWFNLTSLGAILLQFLCVGIAVFLIADVMLVRQVALVLTVALVIVPYNWFMYNNVIWKVGRGVEAE